MKRPLVLHPFLFGLYPVAFLYSRNLNLDLGWALMRPTLVIMGVIACLWLILRLAKVSREKAGLLISILILLVFSFGPIDDRLPVFALSLGGLAIGKGKALFAMWILILVAAAILIIRARHDFRVATVVANYTAAILIALPLMTLLMGIRITTEDSRVLPATNEEKQNLSERASRPHLYYIILDGYGRADVFKKLYDYDNTSFLNRLSELGFYVAPRSTANYPHTVLSLASSLNSQYLDKIAARHTGSGDLEPLLKIIRRNRSMEYLRDLGYQFVVFNSGYAGVEIRDADMVMQYGGPTEFESVLINMTPIPELIWALTQVDEWEMHRRRTLYILDHLADTTLFDTPSFIFAHVLSPHPPFVFGADGEHVNPREVNSERSFTFSDGADLPHGPGLEEYRQEYADQAEFISSRILAVVEQILANSRIPPIIILQGDHGPHSLLASGMTNPNERNLKERFPILNAYYLPGSASEHLYAEITPVNSFCVVLNHFFDDDCELLPDENFFSTWAEPYELEDVTDIVQ